MWVFSEYLNECMNEYGQSVTQSEEELRLSPLVERGWEDVGLQERSCLSLWEEMELGGGGGTGKFSCICCLPMVTMIRLWGKKN